MNDMTKGKPLKLILYFAIPLFLGNLVQQLYNMVDMKLVGKYLGTDLFAAVGAAGPVSNLIISLMHGLCSGFSLVIAKFFGANDDTNTRKSIAGSIVLTAVTTSLLMIIGLVFAKPILLFLHTPEEILLPAATYLRVIFAGMLFTALYNMCAGILRAFGDSKTPLIFLIMSALLNIGLDILFIKYFNMGIAGAAFATIISQGVSGFASAIYMVKRCPQVRLKKAHFKVPGALLWDMYSQGLSMGLMFAIVNIGTVTLQSAINSFGTKIIAAHTAARKISEVYMMPLGSFGVACATYSSQNYGAGKPDRIKSGLRDTILITFIWATLVILSAYFFAGEMISLLTTTNDEVVISNAVRYLRWDTPFYYSLCIILVVRNVLQGLGVKAMTLFASIMELVGKVIVVFVFAPRFGYFAVILSEPVIWIICMLWLLFTFAVNWNKIIKRSVEMSEGAYTE